MNPHAPSRLSPLSAIAALWHNRQLLYQLTRRDIAQRYRGSVLGMLWALATPLLMLAVYTFVFSVVFQARWGGAPTGSRTEFALILFIGLSIHSLFADVLNRSTSLITANANYVKRVVFPLEIMPAVCVASALFHFITNLLIFLLAQLCINGSITVTSLWLPVVMAPLLILALGMAWLLCAIGTFLRDIGPLMALLTTMLLFLSPIFYSIDAIPAAYHPIILLNPLTFIIEQARGVLIWGRMPDFSGLLLYTLLALLAAWAGYLFFQLTRKGFADVL